MLIIDSTGTMLAADSSYLVPDEAFTESEWEDIQNFSDSEIARIGKENGVAVSKSEQLLHSIADAVWSVDCYFDSDSDKLNAIADAIRAERPDLIASRI